MGFGNLVSTQERCHIGPAMTHFPQCNSAHRPTRIKLQTTPALIRLGDGHRAKGKLQVVSTTGGLLQLANAIAEGDFVEVAFQAQSGMVNGMAEMLNPLHASPGSVFQPFRFIALADDDQDHLRRLVEEFSDQSFRGLRSSKWNSET